MAITRPQTDTIISTTNWGIPITDAVNANTTDIAAMKPTAWTAPTLLNGWANYGSGIQVAQYYKVADRVYIRGAVKSGPHSVAIFLLPIGFRPPSTVQFAVDGGGSHALLELGPDGTVMTRTTTVMPILNINCDFSTI